MSNVNLRVYYWAGWHSVENMKATPGAYYAQWLQSAKDAEDKGVQLVVFRIPVNGLPVDTKYTEAIGAIETLLQERFGIPNFETKAIPGKDDEPVK